MKCVSYTRTIPWKNHKGELTIADQNQRIAEYLAEHKELNLQKKYSDSAIQQGNGRKAIEAERAESSMQMKTILAELNMEQLHDCACDTLG